MAAESWNRWYQCLYSTKKVDIYIYTAAVTVAKLAFRIFCDLDRKSRSLCLNYVIGVPWMHGVIVMCFVHRDQGLLILL